jgi:DNA-binding transcriptional LysR family regulator
LRVGASNIPGTQLIPAVLGRFLELCPKVRLEVVQGDSGAVIRQLVAEEIELGFIGGHYDDNQVECETMGEDSIVCVVSPDLVQSAKYSLSQAELCKVPLVVREQGSGTQQAVYEALAGTWIRKEALRIVAELGSDEAIKRAVLNGTGYAFISRMSVADEIANGRLVVIRIPGVNITRKFYVSRRAGRDLSPAAGAFRDIMLNHWQQHRPKR